MVRGINFLIGGKILLVKGTSGEQENQLNQKKIIEKTKP
jgi:hypothetical protein